MKCLIFILFWISLATSTLQQKWYQSEDGSTYYIENENKYNWFQALNECARKNMSLLAIDTFHKHQQFDALIRKVFPTNPWLWLSGNDNAIDNRYEWSTTGEIFTLTNWGPGQPKRGTNHCILLWNDYQWHDLPCTHPIGFICEENPLLKKKLQELETTKKKCDCQENDMTKYKNVIFYLNRN